MDTHKILHKELSRRTKKSVERCTKCWEQSPKFSNHIVAPRRVRLRVLYVCWITWLSRAPTARIVSRIRVSRQAITLMIIYDQGGINVSRVPELICLLPKDSHASPRRDTGPPGLLLLLLPPFYFSIPSPREPVPLHGPFRNICDIERNFCSDSRILGNSKFQQSTDMRRNLRYVKNCKMIEI